MKRGNVPTALVGPVLERLVKKEFPEWDEGLILLAERAKCDESTIRYIIDQKNKGCEFNIVDRLFCSLGILGPWPGNLEEVYYSTDISFTKNELTALELYEGMTFKCSHTLAEENRIYFNRGKTRKFRCRECHKISNRRWHKNNSERLAAEKRAKRAA